MQKRQESARGKTLRKTEERSKNEEETKNGRCTAIRLGEGGKNWGKMS